MGTKLARLSRDEILRYQKGRRSQQTVKRYYLEWRSQQTPPIPTRCDEPSCIYYQSPLTWNGEELRLILDHKNGASGDNRPENLQLLCPNCNSQQLTHGGGNKGKIEQSEGGFAKIRKDGKRDYTLPVEPGKYTLNSDQANLTKEEKMPNKANSLGLQKAPLRRRAAFYCR